jgi:hypothetical protein
MAGWILFAIFAVIGIRIAIILLLPGLDDFWAGGSSDTNNVYSQQRHWDFANDERSINPKDSINVVGMSAKYGSTYSTNIGSDD